MKNTRFMIALCVTGLVSTPVFGADHVDSATADTHRTAAETVDAAKISAKGERLSSDDKFIQEAALGGLKEVAMGRLAQDRGQSQAVKDFGRMLVEDHGKANDELKAIAEKKGIVLSELAAGKKGNSAGAMDKHLAKLNGAEFDKAFASHMVKDHEADIKQFEHEANKGADSEVKAFAANCLPKLREHLAAAKKLDESSNVRASGVNEPAGANASPRSSKETSTTK